MNSELNVIAGSGDSCSSNATVTSVADGIPDSVVRPVRRIQLFFPPMVFSKSQSRQTCMFPLGLGYIGAVLDRAGYEVSLVDCPSEGYDTLTDIGKDRFVYGLTPDEIRARIEEYRPDAIAISCLFSTLEKRMLQIAEIAKSIDPNIIVVCGGPHVSAFYERLMHNPLVDYCVVGEGEVAVEELFAAINGKGKLGTIGSLCRRESGNLHVQPRTGWIEDLDQVPHPARYLVNMDTYFNIGKVQGLRMDGDERLRIAQMTTSRGCPFQCTYCGKDVTWGKSYRTNSAKHVLDEMQYLIEKYGIQRFAFQDDNLTADMQRAAEIFDGMVERKFNVTWEAHNGLGVNFLSTALLEKMKASGCVAFTIAVESANDATLRRVKKPNYIKLAPPIVSKAKELDIEVRGFFMIGFPGETRDEVDATVRYARELDLAVTNFAIVTPLPGTTLYRESVEAGLINEKDVDFEDFAYGAFDIQLSQVPVEELKVVRKVEWMRTMFMTSDGQFRTDHGLKQRDVLDELAKGVRSIPDNADVKAMYEAAQAYYSELDGKTEVEAVA